VSNSANNPSLVSTRNRSRILHVTVLPLLRISLRTVLSLYLALGACRKASSVK
ncbi:hypothetical protein MYCTH_66924, partial [Thermothelomyces thermophilus ATCC 42464]